MSTGPRILGHATDLVFAGLFGRSLPAGTTQEQAVAALRARGDDNLADMLAAMDHVVPGQGVDFDAVGRVLLLVLAIYVAASLLAWLQGYVLNGVVQSTVRRMRAGRRGEDPPAAAGLLRPVAARRAAQPGHQRHRQHQPVAAADDEPAAHLAADRGRRCSR